MNSCEFGPWCFVSISIILVQPWRHVRDCYSISKDGAIRSRTRNEIIGARLFLKMSLKHCSCMNGKLERGIQILTISKQYILFILVNLVQAPLILLNLFYAEKMSFIFLKHFIKSHLFVLLLWMKFEVHF